MTSKKKSMYRYIGAGAAIIGIPARDLTPEEWQALTEEERQAALACNLYTNDVEEVSNALSE